MKIALIASGSRGDVQPYVALGRGLVQAGHSVRLVTHENFESLVTGHGLDFRSLRGNVQEVVESEEMRTLLEKGNFFAITAFTAKASQKAAVQWAEDGLAACQGMDLLVVGMGGLYSGLALSEKLGIPLLQAHVIPFTPTADFPGPLVPAAVGKVGGALNRLSHHLTRQVMWQGSRTADKMARQQVLGLPTKPFWGPYQSAPLHQHPILYGFSPSVLPKPSDRDANTHVTGYWFLDAADRTPPAALVNFLENGPRPVYIGFGSMTNRDPEATAKLVLQALEKSGQRAVLLSGWGGLHKAELPKSVLMLESAPHDWLFPRMAALVHHGGAGTTAAGLRAGVPAQVAHFFGDQAFWGQRIADLGVGPAPIARKTLTVDTLAAAIREMVTNQAMIQRVCCPGRTDPGRRRRGPGGGDYRAACTRAGWLNRLLSALSGNQLSRLSDSRLFRTLTLSHSPPLQREKPHVYRT